MLLLSRKQYESIMVGDDVQITVIEIRGDKVRLGIEAPRDMSVHRREIWTRITQDGVKMPRGSDLAVLADKQRMVIKLVSTGIWRNKSMNATGLACGAAAVHAVEWVQELADRYIEGDWG